MIVVSAADVTMNLAFKSLGANAYSFVRAGSFVLSAGVSTVWLRALPSAGVCAGATVVMVAGDRFSRHAAAGGDGPGLGGE